ncbi:MAG: aspartate carbamoyltransferase catalytic subunit [Erysipelotrichaceae bacterium]|nr:aspartate carbamoyltransferase catalytic subunit [Erysipelotrichaceae bacterium]
MNKNSLLSMHDLSTDNILHILDDASSFHVSHSDWQLPCSKALVANLFFEASTRTHYSFVSAELQLGCKVADIQTSTSSVIKGESLYDTVKTLESIGYDAIVIRHSKDAYYKELENINIPILNAGDGAGDHPTQCLLDLLTMQQEFHTLSHLNVLICGDISHSRVASSNKVALEEFGSTVKFCGPKEWQRPGYEMVDFDEALPQADVVMMLRIQKERGAALSQMSNEEYLQQYGLTKQRYEKMKKTAIIMHPAPVNRGIEIDSDLVEAPKSRIFAQMANGVLVRKAVIKRAFGYKDFAEGTK